MPYTALIFAWRKPGTTPTDFKSHYESRHIPLIQSLAGPHFPKSHTRRYIQRSEVDASSYSSSANGGENAKYPATVLMGTQAEFDYDAFAELVFDDEGHFQTFMGVVGAKEAAERIAADEEMFLDRGRMMVVVVDECRVTTTVVKG